MVLPWRGSAPENGDEEVAVLTAERGLVAASEQERVALTRWQRLLEDERVQVPYLVGASTERIELPTSVLRALRRVVCALARDQVVAIVPVDKQLTTQEAADLLGVSRPLLVRLLEEGRIPHTKTGAHRRVRFDDLMAYKRQHDSERRTGLRELTRMSEELGLYTTE